MDGAGGSPISSSIRIYREDSTEPRVNLIGQKSIKIGLLELELRMCLSSLPVMLGFRTPLLFGRLTRAPAEKNKFPNFVVTEKGKKAWRKK